MLRLAAVFFVIALIAALLATGDANTARLSDSFHRWYSVSSRTQRELLMVELDSLDGNTRTVAALPKEQGARPRWLRYGSALVSVALATFACLLLDPFLSAHPYYLWYVCALLFTLWYGGVGPALLYLFLGPVALAFFVLYPRFSLSIESPVDQFGLFLYCMTALILLLYHQAGH